MSTRILVGDVREKVPELERGRYRVVLADPPWRFSTWSAKGRDRCPDAILTRNQERQNRPERHYATMSLQDIKQLPVGQIAARDSVLFLWATDPMLPRAIEVGEAWGFTFKTVAFYWAKLRKRGSRRHLLHEEPDHKLFPMGTGYWTPPNPEQCLLFTRGHPKRQSAAVRKLIVAPRRQHSQKPDEALQRIEALCDGPYLELFARRARPGWDAIGNELDSDLTPIGVEVDGAGRAA